MKQKQLGALSVSELGLGCMGMSQFYGEADETESLKTIDRAIDLGIDFFDTADMYGNGANEELLRKAFAGRARDSIKLATKFAFVDRDRSAVFKVKLDASPRHVHNAIDASLKRLGTDYVDLYYLHRLDPKTPIEETVGAMAELVKAGKVRYIGLSEVSAEIIERAQKIHPLSAIQVEYSLTTRNIEFNNILDTCRKHNIGVVAYSPLCRGLLTEKLPPNGENSGDFRNLLPRFSGANLKHNLIWAKSIKTIADEVGCTLPQLALAWVNAQGDDIVPIPGTKRVKYLEDNVASLDVRLSLDVLQQLDEFSRPGTIAGSRYPEELLKTYQIEG